MVRSSQAVEPTQNLHTLQHRDAGAADCRHRPPILRTAGFVLSLFFLLMAVMALCDCVDELAKLFRAQAGVLGTDLQLQTWAQPDMTDPGWRRPAWGVPGTSWRLAMQQFLDALQLVAADHFADLEQLFQVMTVATRNTALAGGRPALLRINAHHVQRHVRKQAELVDAAVNGLVSGLSIVASFCAVMLNIVQHNCFFIDVFYCPLLHPAEFAAICIGKIKYRTSASVLRLGIQPAKMFNNITEASQDHVQRLTPPQGTTRLQDGCRLSASRCLLPAKGAGRRAGFPGSRGLDTLILKRLLTTCRSASSQRHNVGVDTSFKALPPAACAASRNNLQQERIGTTRS